MFFILKLFAANHKKLNNTSAFSEVKQKLTLIDTIPTDEWLIILFRGEADWGWGTGGMHLPLRKLAGPDAIGSKALPGWADDEMGSLVSNQ